MSTNTCKSIIDSVHGNIKIAKRYFALIDTPEFQRLRRLEQSPIRSIFPSAHHDRFIHSIGVFHIGQLIAQKLHNEIKRNEYYGINETDYTKIEEAYHIACLLHDIGHAPFSHTFEKYYGKKVVLSKRIIELVNNKEFKRDLENDYEYASEHEYLSAIIVMSNSISNIIKKLDVDLELIVRMIIGRKYTIKNKTKDIIMQIKNCYISLLNGGIIDADRLDYACRDVWASGYATSIIDMERLVAGIHIAKTTTGIYDVCFSSSVLNEIKSLVAVKDFQVQYVINHHVVVYDQDLLERAANEMAESYLKYNSHKNQDRKLPLSQIISENTISREIQRLATCDQQLNLQLLSDDDIIVLIKNRLINQEENKFYKEWKSRSYEMFPVWKTKDDFFYSYENLLPLSKYLSPDRFSQSIAETLMRRFPGIFTRAEDIRVLSCNFKPQLCLDHLNILVRNTVVKYSDLVKQTKSNIGYMFYYVYLSNECIDRMKEVKKYKTIPTHTYKDVLRKDCIKALEPIFKKLYYAKDDIVFNQVLAHTICDHNLKKYITIDCKLTKTSKLNPYLQCFGSIADNAEEITPKGEKAITILNKYIENRQFNDFIGYDIYVNRIRLYFKGTKKCYHYAEKIIDNLNSELLKLDKNIKLYREKII